MRKDEITFESAYANLNEYQKKAVDTIEGPVMVVAGPGTGKTQILTLRVANILRKTDTSPDAIVAITFTESAAAAMRARLVSIIGNTGHKVTITTFHSFCNSLIQRYPEEFPRIIGSQQIAEIDQLKIISLILTEGDFTILRPYGDPLFYVKTIYANINTLKREGVSPEKYQTLVYEEEQKFLARTDTHHIKGPHQGKMKGECIEQQKQIQKNMELARVYMAYQDELLKNRWYDFDDMIIEVISAFDQNENFLRSIQEQYQYILIDEHQDTNNAQNKVIELLCNFDTRPNVFLVGDEKQAIYRFQGASFENFMRIKEKFPDTAIIVLEENYRSSQYILDASQGIGELVVKNPKALIARASHKNAPIHISAYYDSDQEIYGVVERVKERILAGVPLHEIAVLYRDNKDAYAIARLLEREGILYGIESDQDAFSDPLVRAFIIILQSVDDPSCEEYLVRLLHTESIGIRPFDVFTILKNLRERRVSITTLLRNIERGADVTEYEDVEALRVLYRNLVRWVRASHNNTPLFCVDLLAKESNLMSYAVATTDRLESLYKLKRVYKELERFIEQNPASTFHDMVGHITAMIEHGVSIKTGSSRPQVGRVRLMTAHKSKGLEFDYVYIVQAYDGHWGNKRMPNILPLLPQIYEMSSAQVPEISREDEDRKLFYVALTRARKEVYISYARYDAMARQQLPCAYINDIRKEVSVYEEIPYKELTDVFHTSQKMETSSVKNQMIEVAKDLLQKKGLSVTAINNYLSCPWKYFYVNLLTIPQTQKKHQIYGTAIHAALHDVVVRVQKEGVQADDVVYANNQFKNHLRKKPLSEQDYNELLVRGEKALSIYIQTTEKYWKFPAFTEFRLTEINILPEIVLKGVIDRMEIINDSGLVRVIDYKTGKHKSRADIEGHTKSSSGDIYRQLVFYKILLSGQQERLYHMETGVIDFVEPNEKGVVRQEEFVIKNEAVEALRLEIKRIVEEIETMSFWDTRCDDKGCEYCALRNMIQGV